MLFYCLAAPLAPPHGTLVGNHCPMSYDIASPIIMHRPHTPTLPRHLHTAVIYTPTKFEIKLFKIRGSPFRDIRVFHIFQHKIYYCCIVANKLVDCDICHR